MNFYLHLHQPRRLRRLSVFESGGDWFDAAGDRWRLARTSADVWVPVHDRLRTLLRRAEGRLRLRIWVSGLLLEQAEEFGAPLLRSLERLQETGQVEWLEDSYYHSAAFLYAPAEFVEQVELHRRRIRGLFGADVIAYGEGIAPLPLAAPTPEPAQTPGRPGAGEITPPLLDYHACRAHWPAVSRILESRARILEHAARPIPAAVPTDARPRPQDVLGSVAVLNMLGEALANPLACHAAHRLFALEGVVKAQGGGDVLHTWRCLQATDFLDSMGFAASRSASMAGTDTPESPSPYESYINFLTAVDQVGQRCGTGRGPGG